MTPEAILAELALLETQIASLREPRHFADTLTLRQALRRRDHLKHELATKETDNG